MDMPGFTAEKVLYKTHSFYMATGRNMGSLNRHSVVPQDQFTTCCDRELCTVVLLWKKTYCCRLTGGVFTSLWFLDNLCFGFSDDGEQSPCFPFFCTEP